MDIPWIKQPLENQNLHAFYERFSETCPEDIKANLEKNFSIHPEILEQLHFTLDSSTYVQETLISRPEFLEHLLEHKLIDQPLEQSDYDSLLAEVTHDVSAKEEFDQQLRRFRNQSMVRIIWRDFNRTANMQETTAELSYLAQSCIQTTLDYHYSQLEHLYGTPQNRQGEPQPFIVLGMGKLGAYELNLSSDIDLIFAYPEQGETTGANKTLENQEFFSRLGKRLIQSLDVKTAEGFVFRVDMRLRPYGQSGPLVSSFAALEDYYQHQGREWERYAMVKARVIATNGAPGLSCELDQLIKRFTYRKYVDFSVIEALRSLKQMIVQEVKRRKINDDVKLGAGGIREIEFIAQAFQLIRGGREIDLQDNRLLTILPRLETHKCLPEGVAQELINAYIFLRNTEHAIQGYADQQTQKLPVDAPVQAKLAKVMGFSSWDEFLQALNQHRSFVKEEFARVIAGPEEENSTSEEGNVWKNLWQEELDGQSCLKALQEGGHEDSARSLELLHELQTSTSGSRLHPTSKQRLDLFIPLLLTAIEKTQSPTETLLRILKLVKAVARRSAYLLLLIENPKALMQLVKLSEASPWIANQLSEHPALLDELLDQRSLYSPPSKAELEDELRRIMLRIPESDLEDQMETLRYFRSAHALRVAACEITGALPLMKVSDYLTYIAEVIINYVLQLCWNMMVAKHGYPDGNERETPGFIIVGYGKTGGIELGHGSDLDLVFIHNASATGYTNGKRELDNQTFYMRLGQKVIHILNTNTHSGQLYEVDMRLRPSGNSGLLVASLQAFEKYQNNEAWTWEHQALVRARSVSGDPALSKAFNTIRAEILQKERDDTQLKKDVVEMRLKMREHLGSDKNNEGIEQFNLKQDPGGIVDIEFMVQYAVLAWSHTHPALITYTDNIRILENLAQSDLLSAQEAKQLTEAYITYRSYGHRLTLQQQPNLVDAKLFVEERQTVIKIWQRLFETP